MPSLVVLFKKLFFILETLFPFARKNVNKCKTEGKNSGKSVQVYIIRSTSVNAFNYDYVKCLEKPINVLFGLKKVLFEIFRFKIN